MKITALSLAVLSTLTLAAPLSPAALAAPAPVAIRAHQGIQEYKLANGLKVLLVENHAAPVVSTLIVYRVGSRNEAVGYTGSTHFLEHMLFKGTPSFNKTRGTQIAQSLQAQGARFNATTWLDRTNYFETLPADQLDLALRIESDRMRNSFIADADRTSEMSVVRNELERGENNPDRVMWQQLFSHAFQAHPYHHPTIGWRSDVEGVPTERLKKFYQDFYYPNNATLILVGDFNTHSALEQINRYFGALEPSKDPIPQVYTEEPLQQGERRFTLQRPGQLGIVNMGFRVPPLEHGDSCALDLLEGLLSRGVTSRLHQNLVEKQLAVSASASNVQLRDPGLFVVSAKLASGVTHAQGETALWQTLEALQKKPPTASELEKIKAQIRAETVYGRHGTLELASSLGEYEASADWRYLVSYPERIAAVTPADIQRVARTYFQSQNRTVGWFVPQAAQEVAVNSRDLSYQQISDTTRQNMSTSEKPALQRLPLEQGTLILQENHIDPSVALHGTILAGRAHDPVGKAGLARLTAGMLEQGTRRLNKLALAEQLEAMGSSLNFAADLERVEITGRSLSEHLPATLTLLSEILREPAFPAEEFTKLKKQSLDRLRQQLDNTDSLASSLLYSSLYPADHHPLAVTLEQQLRETEKLTLQDVKDFYREHYGSNQMILTVVGDFDSAQVTRQLQADFKGWKGDNPPTIPVPDVPTQSRGQRLVKTLKDKANVSIAMGVQTDLKLGAPDYFAATLANHALGQSSLSSRLGLRVRDELGLTYGIFSYFASPGRSAGPWIIGVTTNPNNVEKTIEATREVVRDYLRDGITPRELELAKSALIGSYLVGLSTNPDLADRLSDITFFGLGDDYMTRRRSQIQAVTLEQVNAALRRYFAPERLTTAIVGNYEGK